MANTRQAEAAEFAALFTGLTAERQQIIIAELEKQVEKLAKTSTPARRAMYYATCNEIIRGGEAIGDEWLKKMRGECFHYVAGLAYLAGVADGKRAERRRFKARRQRAEGQ